MGETQIPLSEDVRADLKWVKFLSGKTSYSEAIDHLIEEAGYEVPEEDFDTRSARKRLTFGGDDDAA